MKKTIIASCAFSALTAFSAALPAGCEYFGRLKDAHIVVTNAEQALAKDLARIDKDLARIDQKADAMKHVAVTNFTAAALSNVQWRCEWRSDTLLTLDHLEYGENSSGGNYWLAVYGEGTDEDGVWLEWDCYQGFCLLSSSFAPDDLYIGRGHNYDAVLDFGTKNGVRYVLTRVGDPDVTEYSFDAVYSDALTNKADAVKTIANPVGVPVSTNDTWVCGWGEHDVLHIGMWGYWVSEQGLIEFSGWQDGNDGEGAYLALLDDQSSDMTGCGNYFAPMTYEEYRKAGSIDFGNRRTTGERLVITRVVTDEVVYRNELAERLEETAESLKASISTNAAAIASKADATTSEVEEFSNHHLPDDCFPVEFYAGGVKYTKHKGEVWYKGPDEYNEIDLCCEAPPGYGADSLLIATFFNYAGQGTFYFADGGSGLDYYDDDDGYRSKLTFNGREPVRDNNKGFPVLEHPGEVTNQFGVVYSNAFNSAVAKLTRKVEADALAASNMVQNLRADTKSKLDAKADRVIVEYTDGVVTNDAWRCEWIGLDMPRTQWGSWIGIKDGASYRLEYESDYVGEEWHLEVVDGSFDRWAHGALTDTRIDFGGGYVCTWHEMHEQIPVATNVVNYIRIEYDKADGRPVLYSIGGGE